MKKVFVTGVAGQLGHDVVNELTCRTESGRSSYTCVGSDLAPYYSGAMDGTAVTRTRYVSLDITDSDTVERVLLKESPDIVIHCAAWTAVDLAEEQEEKVRLVNTVGTQNIVNVVKALDIYGETKLEGELAVSAQLEKYFIVRIAWVFGQNGKNFIKTMLNIGKTHEKLTVVNDQIGTPTYTYDLARLLADMIQTEKYGYYHATNEGGYISWYDFAVEIFRQASELGHPEYDADHLTVAPVTTEEYGASKARRPFNSRLDRSKLAANGFTPLPDWKDALHRYLMELKF